MKLMAMANLHENVFLESEFEELTPEEFYEELFRYSDAFMRYKDRMQIPLTLSEEDGGTWRSVALCDLHKLVSNRNDAYVSACTYFPHKGKDGRWRSTNGQEHADQLCAFVVDLDHGNPHAVREYFAVAGVTDNWGLFEPPGVFWFKKEKPNPTYVVCSGRGLHFYYQLAKPVSMMKRWRRELEAINRALYKPVDSTLGIEDSSLLNEFEEYAVHGLGERDYHGITQPYRVVGSLPKSGKSAVSVWRTGNPIEIEKLAAFAGLEQCSFTLDSFDMEKSLLKREIAATRSKTYVKKTNRKGWNPGFYQWLARREKEHMRLYGEYGHRYKQVQALTVAAIKDNVPRHQLLTDVKEIYEGWNVCARQYGHPEIAWSECEKAIRCFENCPDHKHFPKWWLEDLCGWDFGTQKRNGKTQKEHLQFARDWRDFKWSRRDGNWWDNAGRPKGSTKDKTPKGERIKAYAKKHPGANHSEIARALGVSRPTVIKWLKM